MNIFVYLNHVFFISNKIIYLNSYNKKNYYKYYIIYF